MELNQELNKDHGKRVYWLCLFKCISALTYSQTRHKSHSLVTQLRRLDLFLVQSSLCVTSVHLEEEKKTKRFNKYICLFCIYLSCWLSRFSEIFVNARFLPSLNEFCFPVLLSKTQEKQVKFCVCLSMKTTNKMLVLQWLYLLFVDLLRLLHLLLHFTDALS